MDDVEGVDTLEPASSIYTECENTGLDSEMCADSKELSALQGAVRADEQEAQSSGKEQEPEFGVITKAWELARDGWKKIPIPSWVLQKMGRSPAEELKEGLREELEHQITEAELVNLIDPMMLAIVEMHTEMSAIKAQLEGMAETSL